MISIIDYPPPPQNIYIKKKQTKSFLTNKQTNKHYQTKKQKKKIKIKNKNKALMKSEYL